MLTSIKTTEINRFRHRFNQDYLDSKLKEIETLGIDEQYSLIIGYLRYGKEQEVKKIFETLFGKQKPNLIEMKLSDMKLFSNSFKLFTEKRWEKLNEIHFCKCSFIQLLLTLMINAQNFSQNVNCLL